MTLISSLKKHKLQTTFILPSPWNISSSTNYCWPIVYISLASASSFCFALVYLYD